MTKAQFQQVFNQSNQQCIKLEKQSNQYAFIRFGFLVLMIVCILVGYFQHKSFLYIISLLCVMMFSVMVYFHNRIKKDLSYQRALCKVYQKHLLRIDNQWHHFTETGEEFLDEENFKALDLDIFGHHSLFQMINISFTQKGKEEFASLLTQDAQKKDIEKRQEAVKEFSQLEDFVLNMETLGTMIPAHKEKIIQRWLQQCLQQNVSPITPIIFIVSILTCLALLCVCFSVALPYSQIVLEIGAIFQLCFAFFYLKNHNDLFEPINDLCTGLKSYAHIYAHIHNQHFESAYLQMLQQKICIDGHAQEGIHELYKISQRVTYRQNIFAYIILNAFGLFDFMIRNQYVRWLEKYGNSVQIWFDGLAKIEALMSLSVLKIDDFNVSMPQLTSQKTLQMKSIRHPLIAEEKVVGNDFIMQDSLCIITGSNMSGKTTFMRTIGLNLVLAYAGGYVFADELQCSCMHIMTSMRVKDNVEEGISTFYGELLRIKDMIEYSKKKEPMLCLIDEIFKGTNSLDRIAGAKATIKKLSLPHAYTFLTTHDLELSHMPALNYHFDEYYQDNHICFDYHIKKGPSQTTNGQFLLRQLGILDE